MEAGFGVLEVTAVWCIGLWLTDVSTTAVLCFLADSAVLSLTDCSTGELLQPTTSVTAKHEDAKPLLYCAYLQNEMGTHVIFTAFKTSVS